MKMKPPSVTRTGFSQL